jgi:hypothetical protein
MEGAQGIRTDPRTEHERRRRLARRRLLALAAAVIVIVAAILAFALSGGGKAGALPPGQLRVAGVVVDMSVQKDLPRPTAGRPLKIYFGGDSLTGYPIQELTKLAAANGRMKVIGDYQVSSRLCSNKPINWPVHVRAKLAAIHPGAVVFLIGANDGGWPITAGGKTYQFWDKGWVTAFRKIVDGMMDDAIKAGVQRFYWIGMPIMKPGKYSSSDQMKRLNFTYRYEAGVHSVNVEYINIWGLLATKDGKYDPQWRSPDAQGAHLNTAGAHRIAVRVMASIKHDWLPPQ